MKFTHFIEASGKTRREICEEAKVSPSFLYLFEKGDRKPGAKTLPKLAAALGVEPAELRPDWVAHLSPKQRPSTEAS